MTIEKKIDGSTTVLCLEGWMDTQNATVLAQALKDVDDGTEHLVFDMAKLEYTSSAGIRQIVAAYKQMKGALTLRNVTPEIMSILKLTGLDRSLHFEP